MIEFPKGARHQADGAITFPCRGEAPECIVPGYEVDPGDPYRWIMKWCECRHRLLGAKIKCSRSDRLITVNYCNKMKITVNPRFCRVDCGEIDKVISEESP